MKLPIYAIASVLVFPQMIFSDVDRLTGTFYSFAIFALAFIARPIGSLIFMTIDRIYGRGPKLTIAIFMLGGATLGAGVGCASRSTSLAGDRSARKRLPPAMVLTASSSVSGEMRGGNRTGTSSGRRDDVRR